MYSVTDVNVIPCVLDAHVMYVKDEDSVKDIDVLDARVMYVNDVDYVKDVDVTPRHLRLQRLKLICLGGAEGYMEIP